MIRIVCLLALCAALTACPAGAAERSAPAAPPISERTLDDLFADLSLRGAPDGKRIEAEILRRFERSGSATVDLLMAWANQAIADKTYPLAFDILDQAVVLKPDFPEAWNKRATVHYLTDDYESSLADIRRTLALEPRHFGALSGLGLILQETDQHERAIQVFRRALAIDPLLEKVRETLERLEKEAEQNAI